MTRLLNKKTIVTGGGGPKGIGRAVVRAFAREGADVCVIGRNAEAGREAAEDVRALGREALQITCDISNHEDIVRAVDTVVDAWGRIDVLVNNAGIAIPAPFLEVTPDMASRVWAVNQFGTFFMAQRVARIMVQRARETGYKPGDPVVGKIINVSSFSEVYGTFKVAHYAMTKGAIRMLTRCMALELAEWGILVNGIGAGFAETAIVDIPHEAYERLAGIIPLGRVATPGDIAGSAVFLASGDADYVTGSTVMVDGGFSVGRNQMA